MNNESLQEKVTSIIEEQLGYGGIELPEITADTDIAKDLGADSLDQVELVMALEEEMGIDVNDADAEDLKTVGDVVTYLQKSHNL